MDKNDVHEKPNKPHNIFVRTKGKLPKKFARSSIMRANTVAANRTDDLVKYVDHIKKKGAKTLKDTGKQIIREITLEKNLTEHILNITEDYLATMQNYSEYIAGKKTEIVIDEEFAFLDMVETACRLIYRDQKKILNKAIMSLTTLTTDNGTIVRSLNTTLIAQIQKINQNIYRQNIKTKRSELRYVCFKFDICRYYPAFTDYIADFIVEIRRLPDAKLDTFMNLLKLLLQYGTPQSILHTLCAKEYMDEIAEQMKVIFKDVYSIHDSLSVLRSVLTQRFKIIHSPDLKLKMKTNGVRILLDIINKAFEFERDDVIAMEFDTTVQALRKWVADERLFPELLITQLVNNTFKVLEYNLSKIAKQEIAVLIEVIMRGTSKNEEMYKSLFTDGSKYVRGEDFQSDLEIL